MTLQIFVTHEISLVCLFRKCLASIDWHSRVVHICCDSLDQSRPFFPVVSVLVRNAHYNTGRGGGNANYLAPSSRKILASRIRNARNCLSGLLIRKYWYSCNSSANVMGTRTSTHVNDEITKRVLVMRTDSYIYTTGVGRAETDGNVEPSVHISMYVPAVSCVFCDTVPVLVLYSAVSYRIPLVSPQPSCTLCCVPEIRTSVSLRRSNGCKSCRNVSYDMKRTSTSTEMSLRPSPNLPFRFKVFHTD